MAMIQRPPAAGEVPLVQITLHDGLRSDCERVILPDH